MLALLLAALMFYQGLSMESRGRSFTTAFPENVAFYFQKTNNQLKITVLFNDTTVNITNMANSNTTLVPGLSSGTILTLMFTKDVEVYQFVPTNQSFRITSDKNITVLSVSGWEGRFQSQVVQPDQNLGKVYQVPSLNYSMISSATELFNIRLMIINAENKDNVVTIKKVEPSGQNMEDTITLEAFNLIQIMTNGSVREISAEGNVSVILTHPCLDSVNCSCNMVISQLRPQDSDDKMVTFPVPPIFNITQLLVTTSRSFKVSQGSFIDQNSRRVDISGDILPFFSSNLINGYLITTSVPVSLRLIGPGLVLDLMSTSMFSGCFLVDFNSSQSGALVIANTSSTSGVQMNDKPLILNIKWTVLSGTAFSWALVEKLQIGTIWHPTEKIGVYLIERLDSGSVYGSPGVTINMNPDPNGCLLTPETVVLGDIKMSWTLSREYCIETADNLATLDSKDRQDKLSLSLAVKDTTDGWIALRRSLYTTNWYWKTEDGSSPNVTFTYWADGQPEKPEQGLCASIGLDPTKRFKWKSARCCSENTPVCFSSPKYFSFNKTIHQTLSLLDNSN